MQEKGIARSTNFIPFKERRASTFRTKFHEELCQILNMQDTLDNQPEI